MIDNNKWMKLTAFCGFILFYSQLVYSQDCPNTNISLLSQEDVDNFAVNYPNCKELKYNLCIGNCSGPTLPYAEITNLTGLNQITKVGGSLELKYITGLSNLYGLENLTRVDHNISMKTNEDLVSLDGLGNLEYIGCDLTLEYLPLNTLDGLLGVDSLLGEIKIFSNNNLTNLDGLSNVKYMGSGLNIASNESLQNILGLSIITAIEKSVKVIGNPNLTSLNGLHNIETIGDELVISSNDELESLAGLESLKIAVNRVSITSNDNIVSTIGIGNLEFTDRLWIYNNAALVSLGGFSQLDTVNSISINVNPSLETLDGLDKLNHVDFLGVNDNNLISFTGFDNLRSVGTLSLSENNITDLSGLQFLDSIGYLRLIENDQLQNLNGLKEPIVINTLLIRENKILANLEGLVLDSLSYLEVSGNPNFLNLEGASINGVRVLKIENNASLSDLKGIENLEGVTAMSISGNPVLMNLEFIKIKEEGELIITHNDALVNLSGLDSITNLNSFRIKNNQSLVSFDGLDNLSTFRFCEIEGNPVLADIFGLKNVVAEGFIEFHIKNNPILADCNIAFICEAVQQFGQFNISDNGPGCNDSDDLDCSNFVSGRLVFDYNKNGEIDNEDILLEGVQVSLTDRDENKYSGDDGFYRFYVNNGDEVNISFADTSIWSVVSGAESYSFQYNSQQTSCCNYDFLLDYKNKSYDALVDLVLPNLRCNSTVDLQLQYSLVGGLPGEGKVILYLDSLSEFITAQPFPTAQEGNRLEWDFSSILPFQKQLIDITVTTPDETYVGEKLDYKSEIYVTEFGSEAAYVSDMSGIVLCSYDPNDKQVHPTSESSYTSFDDSTLVFTIRFQNTGNAEAIDVTLQDTLSEYLNAESLRVISTSHSANLEVSRTNPNFVTFSFPYIYLVDSMTNPILSQGFVQYSVNIKSGLPEGTVIENKAHIYFDNNPSIITNTTRNEYYFDTDMDGFLSFEDCNDEDASVNPNSIEIPYNGIDEDCDASTLDDDLDQDGYALAEDCNDEDASVNPIADEIPDNDIDENCDGIVSITTSTEVLANHKLSLYPVPANDVLSINDKSNLIERIDMYSTDGKLESHEKIGKTIRVDHLSNGLYFVIFYSRTNEIIGQQKIVIVR